MFAKIIYMYDRNWMLNFDIKWSQLVRRTVSALKHTRPVLSVRVLVD